MPVLRVNGEVYYKSSRFKLISVEDSYAMLRHSKLNYDIRVDVSSLIPCNERKIFKDRNVKIKPLNIGD